VNIAAADVGDVGGCAHAVGDVTRGELWAEGRRAGVGGGSKSDAER